MSENGKSNAEIMQHVIDSLFHVISQNTTPAFAWLTLRIMLQKCCYQYHFLHQIDIGDIKEVQECNVSDSSFYSRSITSVSQDINSINTGQLGQCILTLIQELRNQMGTQAGYVLLHQFRNDLGERYYQLIQGMGADLQLSEIQNELYGWEDKKPTMPNLPS